MICFSMSSSMSSPLNYAAYNPQNFWNTYNMAAFQGLQRAGVTYGKIFNTYYVIHSVLVYYEI